MLKASPTIDGFAGLDRSAELSPEARRRAFLSVTLEVCLLVSCFVFVVYSTQAEPKRRAHSAPASQQTKHPGDASPLLTPPADEAGKSLARVG